MEATPVDGSWAYDDADDAPEDPDNAAWGYVGKTDFRCQKCHNVWRTPGEYRPYRPD